MVAFESGPSAFASQRSDLRCRLRRVGLRRSRWGLVELHFDDGPREVLVELRPSSVPSLSGALTVLGLELEPDEEARRKAIFEGWSDEEKLKWASGLPISLMIEEFRIRALKEQRDRDRKNSCKRARTQRRRAAQAG